LAISGVPGQNAIWMWALWKGTKYTIRGKVMVSPKSELWWVLWVQVCLWLFLAPKMFKLCINQLVVWFCVDPYEWLSACHFSYSHLGAQTLSSTPKMLRARECAPTPCSSTVFNWDSHLSLSKSLGARQKLIKKIKLNLVHLCMIKLFNKLSMVKLIKRFKLLINLGMLI
jgi:hypothetical protein